MNEDLFLKALSFTDSSKLLEVSKVYNTEKNSDLSHAPHRYREWRKYTNENDLFPTEFLLPTIRKNFKLELPPYMREKKENKKYPKNVLEQIIKELSPWSYYAEFDGGLKTRDNIMSKKQLMFRTATISETIAQILGEDLKNCSILDLASHSSIFSIDMANRGAKLVDGIELRKENVRQAEFLKDYYQIENVKIFQDDVFSFKPTEKYDVVMNLGLLYHMTQPIELLRKCFDMCDKFMFLETICHKEPISAFHVVTSKSVSSPTEGKYSIEFHPTYRSVIDSLHQVGFENIIEVYGITNVEVKLHTDNIIRCFIAFK